MKGELPPTKSLFEGGLRHVVRTFLHMDDSVVWPNLRSRVWPLSETAMGMLRNCLVGALPCTSTWYTL